MSDKTNTKDALGKPIKFGETYGYTTDHNGITDVVICKPIKFTASGSVSIEIIQRWTALYKHEAREDNESLLGKSRATKTTCKSIKLFPVYEV